MNADTVSAPCPKAHSSRRIYEDVAAELGDHVEGRVDVALLGLELPGLEADRDPAVDARLRQIDAAVVVDRIDQCQIMRVGVVRPPAPDGGTRTATASAR